jgi:hypothetical protein
MFNKQGECGKNKQVHRIAEEFVVVFGLQKFLHFQRIWEWTACNMASS